MTPQQLLIKHWGYSSFRPMQEEIINSVLEGNDTLALLPTGGGKSICFQVPGLKLGGTTLVISPLIALMKDQVRNLKNKGINAEAVMSGMDQRQIDMVLDNVAYGNIQFLYVSPERLKTEMFKQRVQKMGITLIAVDESHCISQWGYDFRPAYLEIAQLREYLQDVPVMALTATATPKVAEDIIEKLEYRKGYKEFKGSFERTNLAYMALHEEDKSNRLMRVIKRIGGTGIVYVRHRKGTVEISRWLKHMGVSADFYHAGLTSTERETKQDEWVNDKIQVMVCTNAFGMGIDKPDVRFVVHMDLPESPEAYFQEAGRAGRDGEKAYAALLYDNEDLSNLDRRVEQSFPRKDQIRMVYHRLGTYFQLAIGSGEDASYPFDISAFAKYYEMDSTMVFHSLKILENAGYVVINDLGRSRSVLKFKVHGQNLYQFQVRNKKLDKVIQVLLRSYGGLHEEFTRIDEGVVAHRLNVSREVAMKLIKELDELDLVEYIPSSNLPILTFIGPRIDKERVRLDKAVYEERLRAMKDRIEAMKSYVSTHKCRSQFMREYFGEKQPHRCGICDYCLERNKLDMSEYKFDEIVEALKQLLSESDSMNLRDIPSKLDRIPEKDLTKVIQWMLDEGQAEMTSTGGISLK